jgi:polysaccharide export outer membrane protein
MKTMKTMRTLAVLLMWLALGAGAAVAQDHILAEADKTTEEANASTTGGATTGATDKDFHDRYPRYKLESGDVFEVSFDLNPEFNQTVSVQPDGYISLKSVGDTMVKGQTVPEVSETIRKAYSNILSNPLVSVVLKDFEKPYFIADGQVGHPGKYDLRGEVTLTEAIAMAGGFMDTAKHSQVLLFRRAAKGWYSAETFDVKKMEKKGNLKEDPELHAGDMLFVPKNKFSKFRAFIPGSSMGAFVPLSVP